MGNKSKIMRWGFFVAGMKRKEGLSQGIREILRHWAVWGALLVMNEAFISTYQAPLQLGESWNHIDNVKNK